MSCYWSICVSKIIKVQLDTKKKAWIYFTPVSKFKNKFNVYSYFTLLNAGMTGPLKWLYMMKYWMVHWIVWVHVTMQIKWCIARYLTKWILNYDTQSLKCVLSGHTTSTNTAWQSAQWAKASPYPGDLYSLAACWAYQGHSQLKPCGPKGCLSFIRQTPYFHSAGCVCLSDSA